MARRPDEAVVIVFGGVMIVLLVGVLALIPLGLHAGDEPGDAVLLSVAEQAQPRRGLVTVSNPSRLPVVLGMSLRRRSLRLRLEGGPHVRAGTRRTSRGLRASRLGAVGALAAGDEATFAVPAPGKLGRRAELVVVVGQPRRLRTIRRPVAFPLPARGQPAAAPGLGPGPLGASADRVDQAPASF